ncbi:MAG: response regulator transcription factor [Acidobacteriota bacterium]
MRSSSAFLPKPNGRGASPGNEGGRIRVVIVDDHPLIREALRHLIAAHDDMDVVGEATDGAAALAEVSASDPDVIIMDVEMPGGSGIEIASQMLAARPSLKIVMLSAYSDQSYVQRAVWVGAKGYLVKGNGSDEVVQAVRAVMAGHTFLSPQAASVLVSSFKDSVQLESPKPAALLSRREREVLGLVAEGLRSKEIAARLNIGGKTVDTYRARLMKKLGCAGTADLVRCAIREGLVSP